MQCFKIDRNSTQDATTSGNFDGQVWMQRLITEEHSHDIELLVVSFEAGGRTFMPSIRFSRSSRGGVS